MLVYNPKLDRYEFACSSFFEVFIQEAINAEPFTILLLKTYMLPKYIHCHIENAAIAYSLGLVHHIQAILEDYEDNEPCDLYIACSLITVYDDNYEDVSNLDYQKLPCLPEMSYDLFTEFIDGLPFIECQTPFIKILYKYCIIADNLNNEL